MNNERPRIEIDSSPAFTVFQEVMKLAARDALELGDKLSPVHISCAFESLQGRASAYRSQFPEQAHDEFQDSDFKAARVMINIIGFSW